LRAMRVMMSHPSLTISKGWDDVSRLPSARESGAFQVTGLSKL
jgi:hypothetical protein